MILRLFTFILISSSAFAQMDIVYGVGEQKNPHIILQVRSDEQARNFLVNQMHDIVSRIRPDGNFFENDLKLKRNELLALLASKKMKAEVAKTLEKTLFFDMGGGEKLDRNYVKSILKGEKSFKKDRRFKNKLALDIKINDLSYKVDPSGIKLTTLTPRTEHNALMLDLKLELSKITIKSTDICIAFSIFQEKILDDGDWEIVRKDTKFDCDKSEKIMDKINEFAKNYANDKEVNVLVNKVKNKLGEVEYIRDIGLNINGIEAYVKKVAPLALNITLKLEFVKDSLRIEVEKGSIDRLVEGLTPEELQETVDLVFIDQKIADFIGFSGLVVQNFPIKFDDQDINEALLERKSELIRILVDPIANDLEELVEKLSEKGLTEHSVFLGGNIKIRELGDMNYRLTSLSFVNPETKLQQMSGAINIGFGKNFVEKKDQNFDFLKLLKSVSSYIDPYHSNTDVRRTDMVLSLGENLFNDLIQHSLLQFKSIIKKTGFSIKDIAFNIKNLDVENLDFGENSLYIKSCAGIKLKKKLQRFLVKMVIGKDVNVPIIALADIKLKVNEKGVPEFIFDIPRIVNDRNFLKKGFPDCQISKRFKKITSKIASKKIANLYNNFEDAPLLKVSLEPLKSFGGEFLKLVVDKENHRLNLLISLVNAEHIDKQLIEKIKVGKERIVVEFPKLEKIKQASSTKKRSKGRK